ncbi:MAG: hypothetical protein S4CHLAM7_06530 [Chlamydiae bacterium]|nr:hypothetical protein [Chlamydiota bacterium]
MNRRYAENESPDLTPKFIKNLLIGVLAFGTLSGFFNSVLGSKLNISFYNLFALSLSGIRSGFIWQPVTFIFLPEIEGSLTFYFLFTLCFDIYLLWFIGCKVYGYLGSKTTLKLFFIPSFLAGATFLLISFFFPSLRALYGISFSMIPLIVAYCFSNPDAMFSFMPTSAIRIKWLALGLILLYLFQDLSDLHLSSFFAHILVFFFSYSYMVIFQKKKSPFGFTHRLDEFFIHRKRKKESAKIVHLYETYESHQNFINETLDKIGQNKKISWKDRVRLLLYRFRKRSLF